MSLPKYLSLRLCALMLFSTASLSPMQTACAGTIVTGDVEMVLAPASLELNAFESNDRISLIKEQANIVLAADLTVDVDGSPGVYDDLADLTGGVLPAGSVVNSYLLHFDPASVPQVAAEGAGSVTFSDGQIVGLMLRQSTLASSDFLGALGTTYGGVFRQFELLAGLPVSDSAEVSADRRTVTVTFRATSQYDELRVLIAVPEPCTSLLVCCGVLLLGIVFHRRP